MTTLIRSLAILAVAASLSFGAVAGEKCCKKGAKDAAGKTCEKGKCTKGEKGEKSKEGEKESKNADKK